MWEIIRSNKRKSILLFAGLGAVLLVLGYLIGESLLPEEGGVLGVLAALGIWSILSLISYFSGGSIMLSMSGARQVTAEVHPRLFNVVEEMRIAANLPAMPKVYIIDEEAPNAFATGRSPEDSAIAVTAGLLQRLSRDELQGVVAHEMAHVLNRDILFITFAGVMLGSIMLLSQVFLRGSLYAGAAGRSVRVRGSSKRGVGQGNMVLILITFAFAILAPILARLLYFAISRRREYLADATAARLTRYPDGLASALEKISGSSFRMERVNKVLAPMFIVNPLKKSKMELSAMSSTHPPIGERIAILRAMSAGAGLSHYQEAYRNVTGSSKGLIPPSALRRSGAATIRDAVVDPDDPKPEKKTIDQRQMGDLMRAVNQFLFIGCVCGLRVKIPPDSKKTGFPCPKCGAEITVPVAEMAAATAMLGALRSEGAPPPVEGKSTDEMVYRRKGTGWESFACVCGRFHQLSPAFRGSHLECRGCDRQIRIEGGPHVRESSPETAVASLRSEL